MVQIACGGCGARYQVKAELAGTLVDCPKCHTRIPCSAQTSREQSQCKQSHSESRFPFAARAFCTGCIATTRRAIHRHAAKGRATRSAAAG